MFFGNGLNPIDGTLQDPDCEIGLLFQLASESLLMRCSINSFFSHGVVFDNYNRKIIRRKGIRDIGNNDFVKLYACTAQGNHGCGIYFEYDNPDNNGIEFIGLNCRWNKSHGMHIRGLCNKVIGGHIAYNGGYGILLSDEGEKKLTAGTVIMQPWFEENGIKDSNGNAVSIRSTGSSQKSHIIGKDDLPRVDLGPDSGDYLIVPSNEPLMQILGRDAGIQIGAKINAMLGAIPRYGDNPNKKIDLWINSYDGKDPKGKKIKSNIVFQPYGGGNIVVGRRSVDPRLDNENISIQTAGEIVKESIILKRQTQQYLLANKH
ncbi:MAG: hypothetical protein IPH04_18850 [Saprospirales bacterium]|nr:hypothetical protein [Saprospirales bacterium]